MKEIPQVGEVLAGRYRVERVLQREGGSVVVAARDLLLDQAVRLTILLPEARQTPLMITFFEREARVGVLLKNRHAVRVFDVGRLEGDALYLVSEALVGEEFRDLLRRSGPIPTPQAVDWVLQVGETLAEAHQHGIVHGQLHPGNLFLSRLADGSSALRVLDFRFAVVRGEKDAGPDHLRAILGNPAYLSPEQLKGQPVSERSDIWALGGLLHELLAGQRPFPQESPMDAIRAILQDPPPPLAPRRDLPAGLEEVSRQALEKEPSARHATVAQLARALAPFASAEGRASIHEIERISAPPRR